MQKTFLLFGLIINSLLFSQKIHIKYLFVRSPIATLSEDLYIDGNKVISIQDSIIHFNNVQSEGSINAIIPGGKKVKAFYFISNSTNSNDRDFFFTSDVESYDNYFVHDKITKPLWKIDNSSTKKIAGYNCIKATTNFRGSNVVAYYAKDLPYSVGPFKFFGLPGVILDVRVEGKSFDLWKAEKVETNYTKNINFNPDFKGFTKVEIKRFIELKDLKRRKFQAQVQKETLPGEKVDFPKERFGVESVFEWEK
jgi:GLPGLI family protein